MSCVPVDRESETGEACANCGKHGSNTVKLKNCTACRLIKYCGVDCQKAHRKEHKKVCKKRAAELKEERLYSQGLERPEGDFCPICTLAIPFPMDRYSSINVCCMKRLCKGCVMAAKKRGMFDCPFCRTPYSNNNAAMVAMFQVRVGKKDPEAIAQLGYKHYHGGGNLGLRIDIRKAIELWKEAAELGSVKALYNLALSHEVIQADQAKAIQLYEKAAMEGSTLARHNLGMVAGENGNFVNSYKHLLISANMGLKESVDAIKGLFMRGLATKMQYAEAMRGYQAAVEETKSVDRDDAERLGF